VFPYRAATPIPAHIRQNRQIGHLRSASSARLAAASCGKPPLLLGKPGRSVSLLHPGSSSPSSWYAAKSHISLPRLRFSIYPSLGFSIVSARILGTVSPKISPQIPCLGLPVGPKIVYIIGWSRSPPIQKMFCNGFSSQILSGGVE
jgi:hypothetical protein